MTWIKCSDRLPNAEGEILVKIEGKTFLGIAIRSNYGPRYIPEGHVWCEFPYSYNSGDISINGGIFKWYPEHYKEPSHWMPLPSPPEDI